MVIAKQMDVRANIKGYFDMAFDGETIIVPRKQNKNIVIISEENYNRLKQLERLESYTSAVDAVISKPTGNKEVQPTESGNNGSDNKKSKSRELAVADSVQSDNLEKLRVISELPDGWNGNGAPAFSKRLIQKIRTLIRQLDIQPEVFPTAMQTIQLEYDNSRRDHMEIEIGLSDEAEIFTVLYNGLEMIRTIRSDAANINEEVRSFYG